VTTDVSYGALLDAVRGVHWQARRAVTGALAGTHHSKQRGTSAEFTEYRFYRQGDDPRRIDWRLLARSDRAYIRLATDRAANVSLAGGVFGQQNVSRAEQALGAVADLNLLVNTARSSFGIGDYKFPIDAADKNIGMTVYDATDCKKPTMVAKIDVFNEQTHYMVLWRDPSKPDRVLASVSYSGAPDGVDIRVWDLTGCPKSCNPKMVAEWGLRAQMGVPQTVLTKYEGGQRSDTTADETSIFMTTCSRGR